MVETFMTQYHVTYCDELNDYKETHASGFVCAPCHSDAVRQVEDYYGERNIIDIWVQAWDVDILQVPTEMIPAIEKENGYVC